MKNFISLLFLLILTSTALSQQSKPHKILVKYPNELKNFKLIRNSSINSLIPRLTTAEEVKKATKNLENACEIPESKDCQLSKNWNTALQQINSRDGNLYSIVFTPKKKISFKHIKFPRQFKKSGMGISDSDVSETIVYSDSYGLRYVIVDENDAKGYKKGDLYYIEYGAPE